MQAPNIQTAIPKQRYRLGPYQAVLLGEIESPDPVRYRFILALVREGDAQPSVFITCEKNARAQAQAGSHRMCLISAQANEVLGSSDDYKEIDNFAAEALAAATKALGLSDITPIRL